MSGTIQSKLSLVQKSLKAPKGQLNKFGNYNYRSCEDILEALKPELPDDCTVFITDDIVVHGDRVYVKATATFTDGDRYVEVSAFAREAEHKKGMDESQITGSASSYARKYALNGLFLIDDTKDADTRDNSEPSMPQKQLDNVKRWLAEGDALMLYVFNMRNPEANMADVWTDKKKTKEKERYRQLVNDGANEYSFWKETIFSYLENDDDLGLKGEIDGIEDDLKKLLWSQMSTEQQKKLTELKK